jgi:hypothetical protein
MKFTETAPVLPRPDGPPPWIAKLAKDATLEGVVLKQAVHGKDNILQLISHARTLYEFQDYTYYGNWGSEFFMESFRSRVNGVPVECSLLVHFNGAGEADSVLVNHYPLGGALEYSRLMGQKFGNRFGELYLSAAQAQGLGMSADQQQRDPCEASG